MCSPHIVKPSSPCPISCGVNWFKISSAQHFPSSLRVLFWSLHCTLRIGGAEKKSRDSKHISPVSWNWHDDNTHHDQHDRRAIVWNIYILMLSICFPYSIVLLSIFTEFHLMCTFGQLQSLFVLRKYTSQSKIMNHISLDGFLCVRCFSRCPILSSRAATEPAT